MFELKETDLASRYHFSLRVKTQMEIEFELFIMVRWGTFYSEW